MSTEPDFFLLDGKITMLKLFAIGSFGLAIVYGTAGLASAKTIRPPGPPDSRYVLPGEMNNEGRSIYRMEDRSTFYGGSVRSGPHQPARFPTCDGEPC